MNTYLFDFDGTLVDSMPYFSEIMLRILDENGIEYPEDFIKTVTPLGYKKTAELYVKMGIKMTVDEIINRLTEYASEAYKNRVEAKPDVCRVIKELKCRGDELNVLTASPHIMLDPCLKRLGIYGFFTNIWSCDDFGTSKSNPEIYKDAAARLGKPVEEIIFLDDNYNADRTAKQAGMKVIGVYDKSSEEFSEEIKSVCDGYIFSFSELL